MVQLISVVEAAVALMDNALERIMIDRDHLVTAIGRVNPLYIYNIEQIHVVIGSPRAIQINHDLL